MTLITSTPQKFIVKIGKILIVADDNSTVHPLQEVLSAEGYEVVTLPSGAVADDYHPETVPDLILLDVKVECASVFDLCRALKQSHRGDPVPVICLISDSDSEEVLEALATAGIDCLSKPFRYHEVRARVHLHLINQHKLGKLNEADKAKNLLLCMAAHDLRNPLVSIRALTNVLRAGTVGVVTLEQRDLLDTVYDASQSMLNLVNELLEVSVLEAGKLNLTPNPTPLLKLVTAAVKLSNATAAQKGSYIAWQPSLSLPELSIDKSRIMQVLNNLLDNAVKFSPSGSMITVRSELTSSHCSIIVQDQGPGVPDEERARLFKIFSRTSVLPTGGEPSTGVGLFICHKIMQAHAGTIRVENATGGGAAFRITFPLPA